MSSVLSLLKRIPSIDVRYGLSLSTLIATNLLLCTKARLPISVTELGIVTDSKREQPKKTLFPMLVTELDIVTEVKPEQ